MSQATLCIACKGEQPDAVPPGHALVDELRGRLAGSAVTVEPVDCLAVCKRPCTVALAATGKWTYVTGDLTSAGGEDIAAAALAYARTPDGMIPWRQRPPAFRKGVVARIPPIGFLHDGSGRPVLVRYEEPAARSR